MVVKLLYLMKEAKVIFEVIEVILVGYSLILKLIALLNLCYPF